MNIRYFSALLFISSLGLPASRAQNKPSAIDPKTSVFIVDSCRFEAVVGGLDKFWVVVDNRGRYVSDYMGNIRPARGEASKFHDGYALVQDVRETDTYGYMAPDGRMLGKMDVFYFGNEFNDGFASYRKIDTRKFGIINTKNEVVLEFKYEDITPIIIKELS